MSFDFNLIGDLNFQIREINEKIKSGSISRQEGGELLRKIEECFQKMKPIIEASQNRSTDAPPPCRDLLDNFNLLKRNCSMLKLNKKSEKIASFFKSELGNEEFIRKSVEPFLDYRSLDSAFLADKNWEEQRIFKLLPSTKLEKLEPNEKTQITAFAKELLKGFTDYKGLHRLEIVEVLLNAILTFPKDQRSDFFQSIKKLMENVRSDNDFTSIFKAIGAFKAKKRAQIINLTAQLLQTKFPAYTIASFLQSLKDVKQSERDEVVFIAQKIFGRDAIQEGHCLSKIEKIPERSDVFKYAQPFFQSEFGSYEKMQVLEAIGKIPQEKRAEIITRTHELISEGTDSNEICKTLETLSNLEDDAFEYAQSFFQPKFGPDEKRKLFQSVVKIPVKEREEVVKIARQLISEETSEFKIREILETLQRIKGRSSVFELAQPLFQPKFNSEEKRKILTAINRIPVEEREEVVKIAQQLISEESSAFRRLEILNALKNIPQQDRMQAFKTVQYRNEKDADILSILKGFEESKPAQ